MKRWHLWWILRRHVPPIQEADDPAAREAPKRAVVIESSRFRVRPTYGFS